MPQLSIQKLHGARLSAQLAGLLLLAAIALPVPASTAASGAASRSDVSSVQDNDRIETLQLMLFLHHPGLAPQPAASLWAAHALPQDAAAGAR